MIMTEQTAQTVDIAEHLHPLKESTWIEIFPILAYFDYSKLKGFGKPLRNKNYKDFDNQNNQTNSMMEDDRSFFEKMAEFDDP